MNRYFLLLAIFGGCTPRPTENKADLFSKGEVLGVVDKKLEEASGLAASINNPGYLWTHNDSGNSAVVFLIDNKAEIKLTCQLEGVDNRDWEDIATGPGPIEGKNYIYVADIGDNLNQYPLKFIYRFEEPVFSGEPEISLTDFDTLKIKLPDDMWDSEALTLDPLSNDLFLFSKRNDSSTVYRLRFPFEGDTLIPQPVVKFPIRKLVAAAISPDGQEILLKDYGQIHYWRKKDKETIDELLQTQETLLPYDREPQGEAIAWALDGSGFYTLGETVKKEPGKLLFYKRK